MLNVEQEKPTHGEAKEPFTYGDYLRVPDLLSLQTPLGPANAHDEMLFIIVQQVQELWFKQILFEFKSIIPMLDSGDVLGALHLLKRVNAIAKVVGEEVAVLEAMPPYEFGLFRHVLSTSSGFESVQFRELEYASGLREPTFLKVLERHIDGAHFGNEWPRSLHDAFLDRLVDVDPDPVAALVEIYTHSSDHPTLFMLAEMLSEYEVLFSHWRFHHVKLVERTLGDNMPGTAGTAGAGYLGKTLGYRFFPELWAARNAITSGAHP